MNLLTFLWIHNLREDLNLSALSILLICTGSWFQQTEPLYVKLFLIKVRSVFSITILFLMFSLDRTAWRYSGSWVFRILNTVRRVWYMINWLTVNQLTLLKISFLFVPMKGKLHTVRAALFCKTWRDLTDFLETNHPRLAYSRSWH